MKHQPRNRVRQPQRSQKAATGTSLVNLAPAGYQDFFGAVREQASGDWQKGQTVAPLSTLAAFGAVYACVDRISKDISKLELEVVRKGDNGIKGLVPSSSPFWRIPIKPNPYQNRIQFVVSWILSKLFFGNTYVIKEREDLRGMPRALYVLDPRRATPMVASTGDVYYSLGGDDLAKVKPGQVVPASEIIHDKAATLWHPLVGIAPIYACAMSATSGLLMQRNSLAYFKNMSRPGGFVSSPGKISDPTVARIKREWTENYGGPNIGRLAILGDGLEYKPFTLPPEQTQLIQQLAWTVEDVARAFQMPLWKINAGPPPAAGSVEASEVQYYQGCLQHHIESLELCVTEGLEMPDAGYSVQLNLDGLLRMDSLAQIEMLGKAITTAQMMPDEARARRNLPPVAGGDAVYLQQQNYSLAALAKRDAKEDPFSTSKPPAPPPEPTPKEPEPPAVDPGKVFIEVLHKMNEQAERSQERFAQLLEASQNTILQLVGQRQAEPVPVTLESSPDAGLEELVAALRNRLIEEVLDIEALAE